MRDWQGEHALMFAALRRQAAGFSMCWEITKSAPGSPVLRFTNHDRPLTVGGHTYTPATGIAPTAVAQRVGASVDNLSISGALSQSLDGDDLMRGLYDDAEVQIYLACWTDPAAGLLPIKRGRLGEMKTADGGFETELRGLTEMLQRSQGRVYSLECNAIFGDTRCGLSLADKVATGAVVYVGDSRTFVCNVTGHTSGTYQYGTCEFTSGSALGVRVEVVGDDGNGAIVLLTPSPFSPSVGDTISLTQGCNKQRATCVRFGNFLNFRGFPSMPTRDEMMETPNAR
jgi:uncharacterized phage protein (TIGR02218 family)